MTAPNSPEEGVFLHIPQDDSIPVTLKGYWPNLSLLENMYQTLNCDTIELLPMLDFECVWKDEPLLRMVGDEKGKYVYGNVPNLRANRFFRPAYTVLSSWHGLGSPADFILGDVLICTQVMTREDGPEMSPIKADDERMWKIYRYLNTK